MENRLLHTPEGVRDIYNSECEKKQVLQERLFDVLKQYGYQAIETPTFEYFDVFSTSSFDPGIEYSASGIFSKQ